MQRLCCLSEDREGWHRRVAGRLALLKRDNRIADSILAVILARSFLISDSVHAVFDLISRLATQSVAKPGRAFREGGGLCAVHAGFHRRHSTVAPSAGTNFIPPTVRRVVIPPPPPKLTRQNENSSGYRSCPPPLPPTPPARKYNLGGMLHLKVTASISLAEEADRQRSARARGRHGRLR